jgi:hypothetical protein
VYGVVRAPATLDGIDSVDEAGLAAIYREIDVDDLERRLADENPEGRIWLEETARDHAEILERALTAGAVVPFRLGTVFSGNEAVRALMRDRAEELGAQLDRVEGAREWGVRAIVEPEQLEAALAVQDPALETLRKEAASGAGRAYFARMQIDRMLGELSRSRLEELALRLHDRLAALAREATVNPPQTDATILNGAYLVARNREQELDAALDELASEVAPFGGAVELTGPWPPYNFTSAVIS